MYTIERKREIEEERSRGACSEREREKEEKCAGREAPEGPWSNRRTSLRGKRVGDTVPRRRAVTPEVQPAISYVSAQQIAGCSARGSKGGSDFGHARAVWHLLVLTESALCLREDKARLGSRPRGSGAGEERKGWAK